MKFAAFTLLFAGACVAFPQMSPSTSSDTCGLSSGVQSLLGQLSGLVQELLSKTGELLKNFFLLLLYFYGLFSLNKPKC